MLIRFFQYDSQIALQHGELKGNVLTVELPDSAVLFLRSTSSTPRHMQVEIKYKGQSLRQDIEVMWVTDYTLEDIFDRNLVFLIPFYIFRFDKKLKDFDSNEEKLETLQKEYEKIKNRLEVLCDNKNITEYEKRTLLEMSNKVLEHIAQNYENVKKGVKAVMGGQVLEYEAKTILNQGIERGLERGRTEGIELGLERGRTEGREEERTEIVQNLLLANMTVSFIMEVSKQPEDKILDIRNKMIEEGKLKE